jgi:hypothetical protein
MRFHISRFVGVIAFLMSFCVATERAAQAQPTCSKATLRGSYGFRPTGKDFAAVARFTFDGKGGLTGSFLEECRARTSDLSNLQEPIR